MANQPQCRSIDYFPPQSLCHLNDVRFGDQDIYAFAPSNEGSYYSLCELGKQIQIGSLDTMKK